MEVPIMSKEIKYTAKDKKDVPFFIIVVNGRPFSFGVFLLDFLVYFEPL